jgi:hypothetical protein
LPSRKTYSRRKPRSSIEGTIVCKNWNKQLHTLPVLHFNPCLTTEYSETTAHFNGNFDTTKSTYRNLSAQRLSERTVYVDCTTNWTINIGEMLVSILAFISPGWIYKFYWMVCGKRGFYLGIIPAAKK